MPRTTRARRSRLAALAAPLACAVVAGLATTAVVGLIATARQSHLASVRVLEARLAFEQLSGTTERDKRWAAMTPSEARDAGTRLTVSLASAFDEAGRPYPAALRDTAETYAAAAAESVSLKSASRFFDASRLDATVTGPLRSALGSDLVQLSEEFEREATGSARRAQEWAVAFGLSSVVGVGALVLAVERRRRRTLVSEVEDRAAEKHRALLDNSGDIILVLDGDHRVTYASPSFLRLSAGHQPADLDALLLLVPEDAREMCREAVMRGHVDAPLVIEVIDAEGGSGYYAFTLDDQSANPVVRGLVVTGRDVTDTHALQQRLSQLAHEDELTGLPNRRAVRGVLREAAARADRSGRDYAFVMLDLDGFKRVNDTLGHPVGDALLRAVASRLHSVVRTGELLGRLGGDEFAVVLEGIRGASDAVDAAQRFTDALRSPYQVDDQLISLDASAGIALGTAADGEDDVMRKADIALYEAKHLGRGRSVVFHQGLEELLVSQVRMQREMEEGFERGEFHLVYQPLHSLSDLQPHGFEALMRWTSPTLGVVPPLSFVPVAEKSGFIGTLGRWVLTEACRQLARWHDELASPSLTMSVNVSVRQIMDEDFVVAVQEALSLSGIPAATLTVEITESILAERTDRLVDQLSRIRALGVRVALDDFGTGYSSVGQLGRLPVDCIKIDRSLVNGLAGVDHERASSLVRAVVELGRALDLTVVAEGVESEEQLRALQVPRCDLAQGYLLSRPLPVAEVEPYVRRYLVSPTRD
jgi:diguanylate cyclase (GGDEF)-like protein